MHDTALAQGIGQRIDLVPAQEDPKDLFGLLRQRKADSEAANAASPVPAVE